MRVLMFGWEFPPHISGGLGTACFGLTKALSGFQDVELTFVVPKVVGDENPANIKLLGADTIPVIQKQIQFPDPESKIAYYEIHSGLIPYLGSAEFQELKSITTLGEGRLLETNPEGKLLFDGGYHQNLFQEIQQYALVAEILARQSDFELIHVHDWMTFPAGIAAKRISGKPLLVHVHSTEFDRSGLDVNPAICAIEKEGMEVADTIVAVSNLTRDIIIRNYNITAEKIITVYNAAEPVRPGRRIKSSKTIRTVSFLGRITQQKGPGFFIEAANRILQKRKNVRFIMAGKGNLRDAMIRRTEELKISGHFEFPGFLNDDEIAELFKKSDVFVMPSVSEPFGIVALEALQAGVPLVISKQSGVSEVLNNVSSVDYWDIRGLANAITDLLDDAAKYNKLRSNGQKEVNKLRWENSASQIRNIYLSLLKS